MSGTLTTYIEPQLAERVGHLVTCSVDELRPLPSYSRHNLSVQTAQLTALEQLRDPFQYPLLITRNRFIIDGYARWELAKRYGRLALDCMEYERDEHGALEWFLEVHRPTSALGHFSRIELALDLELSLREKATLNKQAGGRLKELSKLTEADRVNWRAEVARVARASVGNVHKVKYILSNACSALKDAVRAGEVSINLAEKWSHASVAHQQENLRTLRITRGIRRKARNLVAAEVERSRVRATGQMTLSQLVELINHLDVSDPGAAQTLRSSAVRQIPRIGLAVLAPEEVTDALWRAQ